MRKLHNFMCTAASNESRAAVLASPAMLQDLPKPKIWDFVAIATAGLGFAVAAANASIALGGPAGQAPSDAFTLAMVLSQALIASASLFILGKTAKHGTLWGNLGAVAGMLIGVSGVLLAGAMWVAA